MFISCIKSLIIDINTGVKCEPWIIPSQVVFSDVNAKVGAATEKEFAEKYGYDRVRFLEFDCTDGSKFEGKLIKTRHMRRNKNYT